MTNIDSPIFTQFHDLNDRNMIYIFHFLFLPLIWGQKQESMVTSSSGETDESGLLEFEDQFTMTIETVTPLTISTESLTMATIPSKATSSKTTSSKSSTTSTSLSSEIITQLTIGTESLTMATIPGAAFTTSTPSTTSSTTPTTSTTSTTFTVSTTTANNEPWKLVRSVPKGETWHPAKDGLIGIEQYGDPNNLDHPFSILFHDTTFNEVLLLQIFKPKLINSCVKFLFTSEDFNQWALIRKVDLNGEDNFKFYDNEDVNVALSYKGCQKSSMKQDTILIS